MLQRLGVRIVVGAVIVVMGYMYMNHRADKDREFNMSPAGIIELEVAKIEACGKAAERGAIGPGCQLTPVRPVEQTTIIVPRNGAVEAPAPVAERHVYTDGPHLYQQSAGEVNNGLPMAYRF